MQIPPVTATNLVVNPSFEYNINSTEYISSINVNVSDSTVTNEQINVFEPANFGIFTLDTTATSESVSVFLNNPSFKPQSFDSTTTYETIMVQLITPSGTTAWSTPGGGTLSQDSSTSYVGSYSGKLVSTGSTQYANYALTVTTNTAYIAQCYVKGTSGKVVTIAAVENGVTLSSNTVTCDGNWDLLSLSSFTTDGSHTTLNLEISPTTATTINIDAVIIQTYNGSVSGYFDGSSGKGYAWTGTANDSTSTYTAFIAVAASNNQSVPQYGALIDWTQALSPSTEFFTIGVSAIGGPDIIPGTQTFPTYFDQYLYTDYSPYLLSNSIQYSIGQYPYGIWSAQMTMVLDNTTLLFTPGYDPSIGSFILPQRPIRFSIGLGGASIMQFTGTTIRPYQDVQNRTITLTAFDGTDYVNNFVSQGLGPLAQINNGVYVSAAADAIIADLLTEAGFLSSQYVLDQSLQATPIGYLSPVNYQSDSGGNQGTIGAIISDICEAEAAIFFFDESGVAHFWNYQHIQSQQTPQWSFDYNSIVNIQMQDTQIINDVIVQAQPRVVSSQFQSIWNSTGNFMVPANSFATWEIDFSDSNGPLPVLTVGLPAWSDNAASGSLYTTSYSNTSGVTTSDGSQNFISVVATTSEQLSARLNTSGTSLELTFQNIASVPIYITTLQLWGQAARVALTISEEYTSPTSIGLYGTNPSNNGQPIIIANNLIQNKDTAFADAYMLVNNYSESYQRTLVDVFSMPVLQFGDCVDITVSEVGQTLPYTILGMTNSVTEEGEPTQQIEVNVMRLVHYFTINVSSIGGTDAISP